MRMGCQSDAYPTTVEAKDISVTDRIALPSFHMIAQIMIAILRRHEKTERI
jgi:hypothetical protein